MINNKYWSACEVTVVLVRFWWQLKFLDRFSENAQISTFMKVRRVGTEIFHEDRETNRRTDMTKLIAAFRNFANPPNSALYLIFKGGV